LEKAVNAGDDNSPAGGWGLFAGARRARKRAPSPAAAPRRSGRRLRRRYGLVASAVGFSLLILGLAHVPAHALWSYDGWSVDGSYDQIIVIPANFYLDQYIHPTTANEKQREYPSGFLNLETKGDPTPWLHLYSYTIFGEDGTAFATRCQVYGYTETFQHTMCGLKFEESYAETTWGGLDIKMGLQKFAWGVLDAFAPNDIVDPQELYDPFLAGLSGIRYSEFGIPAIQFGYQLLNSTHELLPAETTLQAAYIPIYVPLRFPSVGERWYPTTAQAVTTTSGAATLPAGTTITYNGQTFSGVSGTLTTTTLTRNASPPGPDHPSFAAHVASNYSTVDLEGYYYYGFQTGLDALNRLGTYTLSPINGVLNAVASSDLAVFPFFQRFQSIGGAASAPLGPIGVRGEFAFQQNALFSKDLTSLVQETSNAEVLNLIEQALRIAGPLRIPLMVPANAVQSGVSADYAYESWYFEFQINQSNIMTDQVGLIEPKFETRLIPTISKSFFRNTVHLTVNGLYSLQARYWFFEPLLSYNYSDNTVITLGGLMLGGPLDTVLGQFPGNDEAFIRIVYSF
jgi:hypothetical protein